MPHYPQHCWRCWGITALLPTACGLSVDALPTAAGHGHLPRYTMR